MPRHPADIALRQELLRIVTDVARSGSLTPQQQVQVFTAIWNTVQADVNSRQQPRSTVIRTLLKRVRLGLYGLGGLGITVALPAAVVGSLKPITVVAAFAACLVVLLSGLVMELVQTSLEP